MRFSVMLSEIDGWAEEHDGAGTPMYQAPEVLQNAGVGTAADVFSFGIIMWEMISGEIPYEVRPGRPSACKCSVATPSRAA